MLSLLTSLSIITDLSSSDHEVLYRCELRGGVVKHPFYTPAIQRTSLCGAYNFALNYLNKRMRQITRFYGTSRSEKNTIYIIEC